VKRALAWIAGLAGIAALGRLLARRSARTRAGASAAEPEPAVDPAEELRRRLAEQRTEGPGGDPSPQAEATADVAGETLDERRARIHAKAQEAIASMRGPQA